jgi:DNA repair photolyase
MLNCIYDCRYCFLQGMFRSAHYVLFVNYEDFGSAIDKTIKQHGQKPVHFFSGYNCDSLALEPVTRFTEFFLPLFKNFPTAWLELRTESTQIRSLLESEPLGNCIVAWSFTPDEIARALEHRTPSVQRRLEAMIKLQESGWRLGLRFDPLIYEDGYSEKYQLLFQKIFTRLDIDNLHSVSLGNFRLPKIIFAPFNTFIRMNPCLHRPSLKKME